MGLIQEFQQADAQRRKEVAALAREVAARRGDFRKFVGHLHRVSGDRRSEVATMRADTDALIDHLHTKVDADRRADVAALRSQVATMRADADAFVGHLHKVSGDRRSEVATMRADIDAFVGHLHKVSTDRRRDVAAIRADADAFVRHLHNKVGADRRADVAAIRTLVWGGAAPIRRAAPRPRAAAPPAPPPAAPAAAKAESPETVALRDVVFGYLADHPDGTRLTDMEREFGIARIQIAKTLHGLIDDNKVEKRDLLYFAI